MKFKIWLESVVLYRGSPQKETELKARQFPGVYLTTHPTIAKGYGKEISKWTLKPEVEEHLFDASNLNAPKLAANFMRKYGDEYKSEQLEKIKQANGDFRLANVFGNIDEDPLTNLVLYPNEKWVRFLKSFGFLGMKNAEDYFIFDLENLMPLGS